MAEHARNTTGAAQQNTQERCNEFSKDNKEVSTEVSISLSKQS